MAIEFVELKEMLVSDALQKLAGVSQKKLYIFVMLQIKVVIWKVYFR